MNLTFGDYEFTLMREAVAQYLDELQDDALLNGGDIALAEATARKLKHYRKAPPALSLADILVLIAALRDMRAAVTDYLDDAPLTDGDRPVALETQRRCNRLLRQLRKALADRSAEQ